MSGRLYGLRPQQRTAKGEPVEYECFDVAIENKIARIVLNRPEKRNSMSPAFWDELPAIVQEIDGKSLARVIVIS
jgi:enoyl-CoA hydratase